MVSAYDKGNEVTCRILIGDCREHMAAMLPESVHAIVCDPPYDLTSGKKGGAGAASVNLESPYGRSRISTGNGSGGFMGKAWDSTGVAFDPKTWIAAYRVLKPGGHLLAFGGTRTFHRMTVAIEDAGFEIRDCLSWLYGSGFPKSLDVSKAMDKAADAVGRWKPHPTYANRNGSGAESIFGQSSGMDGTRHLYEPASDLARQWDGWGTALKPAWEPIIVARKPLIGTVAANVTAHGTGAINVDACRIETTEDERIEMRKHSESFAGKRWGDTHFNYGYEDSMPMKTVSEPSPLGRWPANVVLDECAAELLDEMSEVSTSKQSMRGIGLTGSDQKVYGKGDPNFDTLRGHEDTGGASRFFFVAKSSRAERNKGLDGMPERLVHDPEPNGRAWDIPGSHSTARANHHPTVKPVALMQWLVRLVTPPGGTVLDPFMGSGSTGVAADREGFNFIGIEQDEDYARLAELRIRGDCPMFANVELV